MTRQNSLMAAALAAALALPLSGRAGTGIAATPAQAALPAATSGFDAVVEAVRQTVVAAQVAGAVVQLDVKVGDRVRQG